jgi:hypothetical protein
MPADLPAPAGHICNDYLGDHWPSLLQAGLKPSLRTKPRPIFFEVGLARHGTFVRLRLDERCALRAVGAPGFQLARFRRSETMCGQGRGRTADLPLFRGSFDPSAIRDRKLRQPFLPA